MATKYILVTLLTNREGFPVVDDIGKFGKLLSKFGIGRVGVLPAQSFPRRLDLCQLHFSVAELGKLHDGAVHEYVLFL